jgi:hypothetical protein
VYGIRECSKAMCCDCVNVWHKSLSRRQGIQTAKATRQVTASGALLPPPVPGFANSEKASVSCVAHCSLTAVTQVIIYDPVFDGDTLRGLLVQAFEIPPLVEAALAGIDNSTIQLTWRDLMPDQANASIVYQWNQDADNVGSLSSSDTLNFASRSWQFEFHSWLVTGNDVKTADGVILVALLVAQLVVIVVTVWFGNA